MTNNKGIYFTYDDDNRFTGFIEVNAYCCASVYDSDIIYVKTDSKEVKWQVSQRVHDYIRDNGNRDYILYCVGGIDIFSKRTAFIVMYARIN